MLIMEKKLAEIFSNIFKVEENKITDVVSPDNLENWDSLSHMDLVVSIEEEFSVRFSSDEIIEMKNFKMVKGLLASKI